MFLQRSITQSPKPSVGWFLIILWLLWRLHSFFGHLKSTTRRQKTLVIEYPTTLGRWFSGMRYLWAGPDILLGSRRGEVPCAIRTPEAYYVHLSSQSHIKELINAPEEQLSLHALSKDMFQPQYTMNGLQVEDRMAANGSLHSRVLRVMLTGHLDDLQPSLATIISTSIDEEISAGKKYPNNWIDIKSLSMAKKVVVAANCLVFFGEKLSKCPEFLQAALDYPEDLLFTAEMIRLLPKSAAPVLAPLLMRQHRASKVLVSYLMPMVEERLKEEPSKDQNSSAKPVDVIQLFIEADARKNTWTAQKIVQVVLGIWFAAVHQPAMSLVYALSDLCQHPEYQDALEKELGDGLADGKDLDNLPLLDAFLKESARLCPSDSISCRRKVLRPYTFADGTFLDTGDVACVPLQSILLDPKLYPDASTFDPHRFINRGDMSKSARFTDSNPQFPLWGLGKHACPGRYYASRLLKLIIAHIVQNYDIQTDGNAKSRKTQMFYWRSAIVPKSNTVIQLRRKGR